MLPRGLRAFLRQKHRALVLREALRKLRRDPRGSDHVWREPVYGWGNAGFSSEPEYFDAVAAEVAAMRGAILECGSGLTTLVLTTIAAGEGRAVWVLETDPNWCRTIQLALRRPGLSAELRLAPLRDYGTLTGTTSRGWSCRCSWSSSATARPEVRAAAAFGLVPFLGDRLEAGRTILLDDAGRVGEREVLRRWDAGGSNLRATREGKALRGRAGPQQRTRECAYWRRAMKRRLTARSINTFNTCKGELVQEYNRLAEAIACAIEA
jgi:hypothetical protein